MEVQEMLTHLDDEQKERFLVLEDFFAHKGWEVNQEYLSEQHQLAIDGTTHPTDWHHHGFNQGYLFAVQNFQNLPQVTLGEYEQRAEENALEQEVRDEEDFE